MHPAPVDRETLPDKALRYLGLHPDNPATWVLAALSRKYDLDPLLNELAVISTKQGLRPYITRDGLLTIAHRSGFFDGMTTDDLHEGESGWGATVTVWRKDMSHGFTYSAGCGKQEPQAQQGHGPEMALARAERRALHRAFNIPTTGGEWDAPPEHDAPSGEAAAAVEVGSTPSPPSPPPELPPEPERMTPEQVGMIGTLLSALGVNDRADVRAYVSAVVGREVTDTRTITVSEAERIIDRARADAEAVMTEPDPEGEGP